jgi:hypothetical protein
MHPTEGDMPRRSPMGRKNRFDGESARRILQHAAAEQQRLNNELADFYSLEELEEMAAEAGISSEALRTAIEAHGSDSGTAAAGTPLAPDDRPRRRLSAVERLMPGDSSRAVKVVALTTAGGIVFFGSLLAFPAVAEVVLWVLVLLLVFLFVLIALGASPF